MPLRGIDSSTKLVCLLGYPVAHSLSPAMHNAAFRHLGLNICYMSFQVQKERLADAMAGIRGLGMVGANVTVPHKVEALGLMDSLSPDAQRIGAVNTIINQDGRLIGHNTDGYGLLRALEDAGYEPEGEEVVIAGAGGAARACALTLAGAGAARILIVNRTLDKAEDLAEQVRRAEVQLGTPQQTEKVVNHATVCEAFPLAKLKDVMKDAGLLINATSVGLKSAGDCIVDDPGAIRKDMVVCDLVYRRGMPKGKTRLIEMAEMVGARTVPGLSILLYQGVKAFELWMNQEAPVQVMRRALEISVER